MKHSAHKSPITALPGADVVTLKAHIQWLAKTLKRAGVNLENGMQTPHDEAEYLLCHLLKIPFEESEKHLQRPFPSHKRPALANMLKQRIIKRLPAPYVTREGFFAGLRFHIDERVLIPRSRIENIFDDPGGFPELMEGKPVRRALDLGTGSGCLAIALAQVYPEARIDAVDLSDAALEVARINRQRFQLEQRIKLFRSNLFQSLSGECYDLIVTNPPYVPRSSYQALPREYLQEPEMALAAGDDGLSAVKPILEQAARHLTPGGLLLCEVGDETEQLMRRKWPDLPVEWLMFHFGGSGVFATRKESLESWHAGAAGVHG